MYSLYLRLNLHVADSDITVIRAARKRIGKKHRRSFAARTDRKVFYRIMLRHHADARQLYRDVMFNDISEGV